MKSHPAFLVCISLLAALLVLPAMAAELTIEPGFDGSKWIASRDSIALRLSRPVTPEDGRLAVVIGDVDVTAMFEPAPAALVWRRDVIPLPSGEREVVVSLVSASGVWTEVGRFPIKVLTRRGFKKAGTRPSLDLTNKGQLDQEQTPDDGFPSRGQYQDLTGQAGIATEHARGATTVRTQMNVSGVTYRNEALRFGQEGENAPMIDLASYKVEVERGLWQVAAGAVSYGSHRHLINGFSSRGVVLTLGAGRPVSFSLGAMNGTGIVGWDNFLGLQNQDHRLYSATLGFELMPSRPGAVRLETSLLQGSLQPQNSFNQGAVQSAEKSNGGSVRLLLASPGGRVAVDGGYTRSRFRAAQDQQLEEGLEIVPLREEDRDAAYLDATFAVLQNADFIGAQTANVSIGVGYERVEPLFRSVAASLQPDLQRGTLSLNGNAGPLTFQLSHARAEDNLAGLRSILKTKTEQSSASFGLAIAPLFGAWRGSPWIPELTATATHVHQFGAYVPVDAGFTDTHVPDQISVAGQGALEWRLRLFRFGYRSSVSRQDNRQIGRERADLRGEAGTVFVGYTPNDRFDFAVDSSIERLRNLELDQRDRVQRTGVTVSWRVWRDIALSANHSWLLGQDEAGTNERDSSDGFIDLSTGFSLWRSAPERNRSRIFLRYSMRDSSSYDRIFNTGTSNEGWSITSGLNVSVF